MHNEKQNQTTDETAQDKAIQERKELKSKLYTNCFYTAAEAITSLHGHGHSLDFSTLTEKLIESGKKVSSGDLKEIEHMLMTQAKTLDYLFYDAIGKLTDLNMINQIEVFINIAFRAQTQCRKTLAVLAELKHPRRTTFIKQQNNAITQQVNNEVKSNPKNFENSEKIANELLEVKHEQRLDTRTAPSSITTDPAMATMEICRRKDTRRKRD
jgi:hypothetical protein